MIIHEQLQVCISKNKFATKRYLHMLGAHPCHWLSWRDPADRVPSVVTTLDFSHCNNFMFALSFEIKYSIKHHCHYESILQKK